MRFLKKISKIWEDLTMDRETELMKLLADTGIDAMIVAFQKLV